MVQTATRPAGRSAASPSWALASTVTVSDTVVLEFCLWLPLSTETAAEDPPKKVPLGKNLQERSFIKKELDKDGKLNGAEGINMYHFGWRMYDPVIGVWMSVDPAEQHHNVYGYVGGNPMRRVDPDGRYQMDTIHVSGERVSKSLVFPSDDAGFRSETDQGPTVSMTVDLTNYSARSIFVNKETGKATAFQYDEGVGIRCLGEVKVVVVQDETGAARALVVNAETGEVIGEMPVSGSLSDGNGGAAAENGAFNLSDAIDRSSIGVGLAGTGNVLAAHSKYPTPWAKGLGNWLGMGGGMLVVADMRVNGVNETNFVDAVMTGVGFVSGEAAVLYFVANTVTRATTGKSIPTHTMDASEAMERQYMDMNSRLEQMFMKKAIGALMRR